MHKAHVVTVIIPVASGLICGLVVQRGKIKMSNQSAHAFRIRKVNV